MTNAYETPMPRKHLELNETEYAAVMKSLKIFRDLDSQLTDYARTVLGEIETMLKSASCCDIDDIQAAFIQKLLYINNPALANQHPWFAKDMRFYQKAADGNTSAWNLLFDRRNVPNKNRETENQTP